MSLYSCSIRNFASYFSHSLSGIIQGDGKGLAKGQTLGLGLLRALRESTLSYYGKGDPKNFFLNHSAREPLVLFVVLDRIHSELLKY